MFRAFRHRNYRLFFAGQSISLIGTWVRQTALGWLVYRLTDSPLMLGVVVFCSQIPTFLIAPFAGVLADKWNRHHLLIICQILSMMQALILTYLVLAGHIEIWQIITLAIILGIVNSFDIPVRQTFTFDMVENTHDLGNAIALNSSMFNAARLIGASLAGILIVRWGEGICFLINGLTYLPVIAALLAMKIKAQHHLKAKHPPVLKELKEGIVYAWKFPPIRTILLFHALISLMGMPYAVTLPIFARDILESGPRVLGFLMGASGLGALIGAIFLASRKNVRGLGKIIVWATAVFGLGLITFSFSSILWISLPLMVFTGFGMLVETVSTNTVLQSIVDDDKRGRVMSFYTMAFMGMAPLGSLMAGSLASKIGAPHTLILGGVCCLLGSLLFARELPELRKLIHPIYIRKGIIPQPSTEVQIGT